MTTESAVNFQNLGVAAQEIFVWPGTWLLTRLPEYAPGLAITLGVNTGDDGVVLPVIASVVAWSLLLFLAWKTLKIICISMFYGARRINTLLTCKLQVRNRRRLLSQPVEIPQVDFDDLDVAVLNMGSTIPPGFALTAAELCGQLTKRPAQVQQSLEKLKRYGLVDDVIGTTDGFDNYRLTRSGAALLSMWQRRGLVSRPA